MLAAIIGSIVPAAGGVEDEPEAGGVAALMLEGALFASFEPAPFALFADPLMFEPDAAAGGVLLCDLAGVEVLLADFESAGLLDDVAAVGGVAAEPALPPP